MAPTSAHASTATVLLTLVFFAILACAAADAGGRSDDPVASVHALLRHETQRRRSGASVAGSAPPDMVDVSLPLYARRAEYFAVLLIGTPPRRVRAQVDTGSSMSFVVGAPCTTRMDPDGRCTGYFDVPYDTATSNTSSFVGGQSACRADGDVTARFADGSTVRGCYATDLVGLAGSNLPRRLFTFMYVVASSPGAQAARTDVGPLLGLAPPDRDSPASGVSVLTGTPSFTLSLGNQPPLLRFGNPRTEGPDKHMRFVPLLPTARGHLPGLRVRSTGLRFGNVLVGDAHALGDCVIDSGALFIGVPYAVLVNIRLAIRAEYCRPGSPVWLRPGLLQVDRMNGHGYVPTMAYNELLASLPPITIVFRNVYVEVPPTAYLLRRPCVAVTSAQGRHCFVLALTASDGGYIDDDDDDAEAVVNASHHRRPVVSPLVGKRPFTVLGEPFLRAISVAYDAATNHVGLMPAKDRHLPPPKRDLTTAAGRRAAIGDRDAAVAKALAQASPLIINGTGLMVVGALSTAALVAFFVIRRARSALLARGARTSSRGS